MYENYMGSHQVHESVDSCIVARRVGSHAQGVQTLPDKYSFVSFICSDQHCHGNARGTRAKLDTQSYDQLEKQEGLRRPFSSR
jgi:hypothetical protein